jgi:hypothetical protein
MGEHTINIKIVWLVPVASHLVIALWDASSIPLPDIFFSFAAKKAKYT